MFKIYIFLTSAGTKCQVEAHRSMFGAYKPQCDEQGNYKPVQCWHATHYCWCVDENGTPIEGTSMRGIPDCGQGKGRGSELATGKSNDNN